jgi:RimJ/RimL family protein N-acetyltransferase
VNLRLADGLEVEIRPIRPEDKGLLVAGLRLLSEETRHRRFLAAKPRFSSTELRYLTEVDGRDHFALVAVEAERPSHIVAVARFVRDRQRPDTAEFAIVVGDAYQRRGAGRALARMLASEARARGITHFTAVTLADNVGAQKLIASLTEHLVHVPGDGGVQQVVGDLVA